MHRRLHHGALGYPHRRVRFVLWLALIAVAYYGAAKLGTSLSVSRGVITPVWAPSGIALASLLILGVRYWPAVAIGAFTANATSGVALAIAAGISVGNTLAAVVGAVLVQRIGFTPALDRVRSVLALVVGGAVVSTAVSATNGTTVLALADELQDSYGSAWLLWWFGDAMGILVVAPIMLVLYDASRRARPHEAASRRGRRAPHRRGRHERDRLPRGSLALSVSDFSRCSSGRRSASGSSEPRPVPSWSG